MKRSELTHRRLIHIKKDQSKGYYNIDNQESFKMESITQTFRLQKKHELEGHAFVHELMDTSLTGL